MADDNASGGGFDFGLGDMTAAWQTQTQRQQQRQKEELLAQQRKSAAALDQARITQKSAEVSQNLLVDIEPLMGEINQAEQGRQEQKQLLESGDPFGLLQAIGNQVVNPSIYTESGRQRTIANANQQINIKTQVASLQQSALGDLSKVVDANLAASNSGLDMAKLLEQQNAETIQTEIARVQSQGQVLAANNALQEQKLAMMSDEQVQAAYASSKGQPVDIGGVMISPGQLQNRMQMLEQRNDIREARAAALELKNDTLARKMAKRELESYSVAELEPMIQKGDPRFDLADIKQVYDTKKQAQADELARAGQAFSFADFGARVTVPAMQDAEKIGAAVPKGTPLAGQADSYRNTVGMVMSLTKPYTDKGIPVPVEVAALADKAIKDSREQLDKEIDKEATRQGKGDKNLTDIYRETYRGNPIPQASIEGAVMDRLNKNKPLTDIFPKEQAIQIRNKYNQGLMKLKQQAATNPLSGMTNDMMEQKAMQDALAEAVTESVANQKTQELYANQLQMPGNPLNGVFRDANELGMVQNEADAEGANAFAQARGLTPEELTQVLNGQSVPGKVSPADMRDLAIQQQRTFMLKLDARRKGLARDYANWWAKNGTAYADSLQQMGMDNAKGKDLQSQALETYAGPIAREAANNFMQTIGAGEQGYQSEVQTRQNRLVSFDQNPEYTQASLLSWDNSLDDRERQIVMQRVIRPVIENAKQQKLGYEETNQLVESIVAGGFHPDSTNLQDVEAQKILQKMQKNRQQVLGTLETVFDTPWWSTLPDSVPQQDRGNFSMIGTDLSRLRRNARSYDWYKSLPPSSK